MALLTGSGRSIDGVDLFENLSLFSHLYLRYGGHARAAGVTITAEKYEEFKQLFTEQIERAYRPEDFFPSFTYEETALFSDMTAAQVKEVRLLAPFGEKNPEPVYRFNGVKFMSLRTIGKDDKHFCSSVVQGESRAPRRGVRQERFNGRAAERGGLGPHRAAFHQPIPWAGKRGTHVGLRQCVGRKKSTF